MLCSSKVRNTIQRKKENEKMEKKTMEKQKVSVKKQQWKPGNMLYPLPAVLVSLGREGEKPNMITVAWTGTVCTNPPMVYISVRPERYSHAILKETKTFVINLTTEKTSESHRLLRCPFRKGCG